MTPRTASRVEAERGTGDDRVAVFERDRTIVAAVADGAGGTSGGAAAAQELIDTVARALDQGRAPNRENTWTQVLLETSIALEPIGQTTGAVAATWARQVVGASVGDSGIILVTPDAAIELTENQVRKPLLGGGLAKPVGFARPIGARDAVLLASDGILKYARRDDVHAIVRDHRLSADERCARIIDAARLPNRSLQDDAAVVLIRPTTELHEEALVESARTLKRTPSEACEDAFTKALDSWISAWVPFNSDGLKLGDREHGENDLLRVSGHCWEITTQALIPFEAELVLGPSWLESFELRFGDQRFSRPDSTR